MSRRPVAVLVLALASLLASACADVTAPRRETPPTDTTSTCVIWNTGVGITCQ